MTVTRQPAKTKPARSGKRDAGHGKTPRQSQIDTEMRHLGIGIDTGRYGHHISFLREDKQCAAAPMTVMEKADDYAKLRLRLEQLHQRFPNAHLHLRIDAAGQYADNIEAFVRSLDHLPMTVSVGQPKLNKDYHSVCAPKSQTDKTESYAMARYAVVERPQASYGIPPEFTTLKRIANRLHGQVKQSTRLTNQLHETLSAVFTELATIVTNLAVPWVLAMLAKYPTAKRIAAARQSSLLVQELVSELTHSLDKEQQWKKLLVKAFDSLPDGPHKRIATIKGIGKQTAAAIVATAISIDRFESDGKLIGYYGVFPKELQSGVDKFGRPIPPGKKIMCRQGNDLVRGLLWQCAKCASGEKGGNPEVRALYLRRIAAGDTAMTAWGYCMTKLLRQVYGVWSTDTDFDPEHEQKRREARQSQRAEVEQTTNEAEKETEASGHKDESCSEETCKVVTETPASVEPVYEQPADPYYASAALTDQAMERPLIDYGKLRSQVSMADVLTHIGYPFNASAVQFRGKCPLHDGSVGRGKTFSVSFKRDLFRCFESTCQKQGNVLDFWSEYRQLPLYEAALDLAKTFNIELPKKLSPCSERSEKKGEKKGGHTPPSH